MKSRTPWYNHKIAVIIFIFLFFPLGLYGLWKNQKFSRFTKYTWTIFILFGVIVFSFTGNQQPDKQIPTPAVAKKAEAVPQRYNDNTPEVIQARAELKTLYQDLLSFKDQHQFHQMGFGGNHRQASAWLDQVKILDEKLSPEQYPFNLCVAVGELKLLGRDYMRNKGQETEYSTTITPSIKKEL